MQTITEALESTLASDKRFELPEHVALVSLCRLLAGQIEDAGSKAPTRLTAAYLSALKDLGRILTAERRPGRGNDDEGPSLDGIRATVTALKSA